jgi:hypothetical protein
MLPVRGDYQVIANVKPATLNAFAPFQQVVKLSVPERGVKYQNFAILALGLMAVGGLGGWVIGSRQPTVAGEVAPRKVRVLLSGAALASIAALLYVNVSAEQAQSGVSQPMSHMNHAVGHSAAVVPVSTEVTQSGLTVKLTNDSSAMVGEPTKFQVQVIDAATKLPVVASIAASIGPAEDEFLSFAHQNTTDASGILSWQTGIFDGAPHRVNVSVSPAIGATQQFSAIKLEKEIEVAGVAPPIITRLISLGYMTGIVASAFLVAFWWRRRQIGQQQLV